MLNLNIDSTRIKTNENESPYINDKSFNSISKQKETEEKKSQFEQNNSRISNNNNPSNTLSGLKTKNNNDSQHSINRNISSILKDENTENNEQKKLDVEKLSFIHYKNKIIFNIENEYKKEKGKKENKYSSIKTTEFIKEININLFVSGGMNIDINFYDKNYEKNFTFSNITKKNDNLIYSLYVNPYNNANKKKFEIIFCCVDKSYIYEFNCVDGIIKSLSQGKNIQKYGLYSFDISNSMTTNFVLLGENGVFFVSDLFSKLIAEKETEIYSKAVHGGILMEKNILALITNFNLYKRNAKNSLLLYNIASKSIVNKLDYKYQFNLSQNNMIIMKIINNNIKEKTNKVLLCACKKYIKGQKNGILILNYNFNDNKEIIQSNFYETKNFEPYCFCHLSIYKKKQDEVLNSNYEINDTDYFLIGGFDLNKNKGIIKLFKLVYDTKNKIIIIKYIEDAVFSDEKQKSKYFRGPISCIIQTKMDGNIIICFMNGNICLFSSPNCEFFENIKNNNSKNYLYKLFTNKEGNY